MSKRADARQADIFGAPDPPPARPRRRAPAVTEVAPPAAPPHPPVPVPMPVPESPAELAARASHPELDEFVDALSDDRLAHLTLAGVRALRRRLGRRASGGLARAARLIAAELGGPGTGGEDGF